MTFIFAQCNPPRQTFMAWSKEVVCQYLFKNPIKSSVTISTVLASLVGLGVAFGSKHIIAGSVILSLAPHIFAGIVFTAVLICTLAFIYHCSKRSVSISDAQLAADFKREAKLINEGKNTEYYNKIYNPYCHTTSTMQVYLGGFPLRQLNGTDVKSMVANHLNASFSQELSNEITIRVDLTEKWECEMGKYSDVMEQERSKESCVHVPTLDRTVIKKARLQSLVDEIETKLRESPTKSKLYFHCKNGKGRSAQALAAWIIHKNIASLNADCNVNSYSKASAIVNYVLDDIIFASREIKVPCCFRRELVNFTKDLIQQVE